MSAARARAPHAPVHLLDGNVLVALVCAGHVHHAAAKRWLSSGDNAIATCPITQGTLLRLLMQLTQATTDEAVTGLGAISSHPRHRFWADDIGYDAVSWRGVIGHRQVTDAYLAGLARQYGGRLATFDRGLQALHADVAVAIAT